MSKRFEYNKKINYSDFIKELFAKAENIEEVDSILSNNNIPISIVDENNNTLLHYVLLNVKKVDDKIINIINFYINKDIPLHHKNNNNEYIIHLALKLANSEIIELLINKNKNIINTKDQFNNYPIHYVYGKYKTCIKLKNKFILELLNRNIITRDINERRPIRIIHNPNQILKIDDIYDIYNNINEQEYKSHNEFLENNLFIKNDNDNPYNEVNLNFLILNVKWDIDIYNEDKINYKCLYFNKDIFEILYNQYKQSIIKLTDNNNYSLIDKLVKNTESNILEYIFNKIDINDIKLLFNKSKLNKIYIEKQNKLIQLLKNIEEKIYNNFYKKLKYSLLNNNNTNNNYLNDNDIYSANIFNIEPIMEIFMNMYTIKYIPLMQLFPPDARDFNLGTWYNHYNNNFPYDSFFENKLTYIYSIDDVDGLDINDRIKSYINLQYHDISIPINLDIFDYLIDKLNSIYENVMRIINKFTKKYFSNINLYGIYYPNMTKFLTQDEYELLFNEYKISLHIYNKNSNIEAIIKIYNNEQDYDGAPIYGDLLEHYKQDIYYVQYLSNFSEIFENLDNDYQNIYSIQHVIDERDPTIRPRRPNNEYNFIHYGNNLLRFILLNITVLNNDTHLDTVDGINGTKIADTIDHHNGISTDNITDAKINQNFNMNKLFNYSYDNNILRYIKTMPRPPDIPHSPEQQEQFKKIMYFAALINCNYNINKFYNDKEISYFEEIDNSIKDNINYSIHKYDENKYYNTCKKQNIVELMAFLKTTFLSHYGDRIIAMFQKFALYIFKYNLYYGSHITINCEDMNNLVTRLLANTRRTDANTSRQYSLLAYLNARTQTEYEASATACGAGPLGDRGDQWRSWADMQIFGTSQHGGDDTTHVKNLYTRIQEISILADNNMKLYIINIYPASQRNPGPGGRIITTNHIEILILLRWNDGTPQKEILTFKYQPRDGRNQIENHKLEILLLILDLHSILKDYMREAQIQQNDIDHINRDIMGGGAIPEYAKPVNLFHRYNYILFHNSNYDKYFDSLKHLYVYCTENYEQELFFTNNPLINIDNLKSLIYKLHSNSSNLHDTTDYYIQPGNRYNIDIKNSNCIYLLENWTGCNLYDPVAYNDIRIIFSDFNKSLEMIEKNISAQNDREGFNYNFKNIINKFRRNVVSHNNSLNNPENFRDWETNIDNNIHHQIQKDYLGIGTIVNLLWIIICRNNNYINLLEDNKILKKDIINILQPFGINVDHPFQILQRPVELLTNNNTYKKIYYNLINIFFSFNSKKNLYIYEILFELYWILLCGSDLKYYINQDKKKMNIYNDIIEEHTRRRRANNIINLTNRINFQELIEYYDNYIKIINDTSKSYITTFKESFIKNIKQLFNNLSNIDINTKDKYLLNKYKYEDFSTDIIDIPDPELQTNIINVLLNYKEKTDNIEQTYEELFVSSIKVSNDNNINLNIEYDMIQNQNYSIDYNINNRFKFSNINNIFEDYDNELTKLISLLSKYTESALINNKYMINYTENLIRLIVKYIKTKTLINDLT